MNSSVFLSNFEKTGTTFTDGYFAAFCGARRTVANTPPGFNLGDQLLCGCSADRIRNGVEQLKIRNRVVVVGCDYPIRAGSLRLIQLLLQNPRDHSRPAHLSQ